MIDREIKQELIEQAEGQIAKVVMLMLLEMAVKGQTSDKDEAKEYANETTDSLKTNTHKSATEIVEAVLAACEMKEAV
jgi:hypothetical protein